MPASYRPNNRTFGIFLNAPLVCRSWRYLAQRNAFHTIHLNKQSRVVSLAALLLANPVLNKHIRKAHIHTHSLSFAVLPPFLMLDTVVVSVFDYDGGHPQPEIGVAFQNVTSLALDSCCFPSLSGCKWFVAAFPRLRHFSVKDLAFWSQTAAEGPKPELAPDLELRELVCWGPCRLLLQWLLEDARRSVLSLTEFEYELPTSYDELGPESVVPDLYADDVHCMATFVNAAHGLARLRLNSNRASGIGAYLVDKLLW